LVAIVVGLLGSRTSAGATDGPAGFVAPVRGNGLIAFTSERSGDREILTMRIDGSQQTNISNDHAFADDSPAWSPDGRRIAFTSDRTGDSDIWVMGPTGSNPTDLTNAPGASDEDPAWSPDGSRIAFASDRGGDVDIWVMNADGSNAIDLTSASAGSDTQPAWSPEGASIAFTSDRSGDEEIWTTTIDGAHQVNLSNAPGVSDSEPSWSPDGARIAFTSDRNGAQDDLFVMNADGTGQADFSNMSSGPESDPVFSPDRGTRVLLTTRRGRRSQIGALNFTPTGGTFGGLANLSHDPARAYEPSWQPLPEEPTEGTPIRHVVLMMMENRDFDHVLGYLCVLDARCDGATEGRTHDGSVIPLRTASDLARDIDHSPSAQGAAMAGGMMNGFDLIRGCRDYQSYDCYVQYQPEQIPNEAALARDFALSDRTFENDLDSSWVSHLQLIGAWRGGFAGQNPSPKEGSGPGWGCDSLRDAIWQPSVRDFGTPAPSCIPSSDGSGPYRESPVPWMPSILDRMEQAGTSFTLYAPTAEMLGYQRALCPSFADCLNGEQAQHQVSFDQFPADARAGNLPAVSFLIPDADRSQHPPASMLVGDNWIGEQLSALMEGPDWATSAVFITWDDCGCFYDHVPPPAGSGFGVRMPMLIVSPYAVRGYTDSRTASFSSMLTFVEHTFGLAPLGTTDANAYDYADSFDYSQDPRPGIPMVRSVVPAWELRWLREHPLDTSDEP
jgi:Phosphoesterase family/WD40-like Beta Propeller Repeat